MSRPSVGQQPPGTRSPTRRKHEEHHHPRRRTRLGRGSRAGRPRRRRRRQRRSPHPGPPAQPPGREVHHGALDRRGHDGLPAATPRPRSRSPSGGRRADEDPRHRAAPEAPSSTSSSSRCPTRRSGCRGTRATSRPTGTVEAEGTFVGRFNEETFSVAPASRRRRCGTPRRSPTPSHNPATAPVHPFHLGLWFNSPEDAAAAGCRDRRDAVQRRAQRRRAGAQHPELRTG